jgi:fatty acid desaturase
VIDNVQWKDLLQLRRREVVAELLLSAPWLVLSLAAAAAHLWLLALPASFLFFLTGLRQVHNAFHHALGLPKWVSDAVMFVLSVLMLGSMHAVQANHLRHHRHCMEEDDVEAMGARLSAWGAILLGPRYPWALHRHALRLATPSLRRWMQVELAANLVWIGIVIWSGSDVLIYHVLAMAVGQCFTAFFAVWTTHHDCDERELYSRSIRNRFKAAVTYNMFYHFEHHAFPAVPTCKLPELARRLDAAQPALDLKRVF